MLDNFSPEDIAKLRNIDFGDTKIEVSGNIDGDSLQQYLDSAVNYISSGSLTKHIRAIDLSMRLVD
jgi:nicotinate-nucleotide pyrophosphorylase (carboxylating)